jgi:hypothetical protein
VGLQVRMGLQGLAALTELQVRMEPQVCQV